MDVKTVVAAIAVAACSGGGAKKPHVVEDAPAVAKPVVPAGPYRVDATFDKGDVQIRVEWKDVPVEARASAGRTACGTAKLAAVAPTTTWGIPDVVVMIDANHGKPMSGSGTATGSGPGSGSGSIVRGDVATRIVLDHCALALDADSINELRADEDSAIAVVAPTPYYAITEANGQVVLRDVPVGTFEIAAWLPARAAHGKVTVTAGALAEVTLSF